ncbi:MAG TPA: 5-bromo-4-chloroindolyl phosphate hydrolysis family protein [Devosiaceae bacterium]|jgi:5-bromo-4-chloroindolyl phosphate hydrolysis protein
MRIALPNDWNWIVAGLAALLVVLALTLGLGVPFIIAAAIAVLAFAGLVILLSPRRLFEGMNVNAVGTGRVAFARDLLLEATPSLDRLRASGAHIKDKDVAEQVRHLATIATDVFDKVEANPANASTVKRFLSYYLPQAAQVAEAFDVLEDQHAPNPARLREVRRVVEKLEKAFVHYADGLAETELGTLDTDLRLIEASLNEDLGR